jgi:hypothetical protein
MATTCSAALANSDRWRGGDDGMRQCELINAVAKRRRSLPLLVGLIAFVLLAAGCGGGTSAQDTPTNTPVTGVTAIAGQTSATPTQFVVGGPGAQVGVADVCTAQPEITTSVPSSIPMYPGAELRLSDFTDGGGDFGFCANASPTTIATFYVAQLPRKGWQSVTGGAFGSGQQVTAANGSAYLVATIMPDAHISGAADILIVVSGM